MVIEADKSATMIALGLANQGTHDNNVYGELDVHRPVGRLHGNDVVYGIISGYKESWIKEDDLPCTECGCATQFVGNEILLCENDHDDVHKRCRNARHKKCCKPPLKKVPKGK